MFNELKDLYARLERNEFLLGMLSGIVLRHIDNGGKLPEGIRKDIDGYKLCMRSNEVTDAVIREAKTKQFEILKKKGETPCTPVTNARKL
jgi:hypothetical protein